MSVMRCATCGKPIDTDLEIPEQHDGEVFHEECWAAKQNGFDDEALDDPRRGQAADLNRKMR